MWSKWSRFKADSWCWSLMPWFLLLVRMWWNMTASFYIEHRTALHNNRLFSAQCLCQTQCLDQRATRWLTVKAVRADRLTERYSKETECSPMLGLCHNCFNGASMEREGHSGFHIANYPSHHMVWDKLMTPEVLYYSNPASYTDFTSNDHATDTGTVKNHAVSHVHTLMLHLIVFCG